MGTPLRLRAIAQHNNLTIDALLIREIERTGSLIKAAQFLGVNPNSVRYNLRKSNLKIVQVTKVVKS